MVAGPLFVSLSEPNIAPKDHASPPCFARAVWGLWWPYVSPRGAISRTLGPIDKTAQGRVSRALFPFKRRESG